MPTTTADNRQTAEMPTYRASREVHPAEKARFRFERPFTDQSALDRWQYGERTLKAGEEISTREWPHPSFYPLNDVARRIHGFFTTRQKSRLARSPYGAGGQLQLADGLTGTMPKIVGPQVQPMDLRPVRF